MPETTKTGLHVFPIRDAGSMQKDGWFIRKTNTKGVSVRLAKLKSSGTTVVQAWIFDSKEGWTLAKAKKWLKDQDIKWIAELNEDTDTYKGVCIEIAKIESNQGDIMAQEEVKPVDNGNGGLITPPAVPEPGEGLPQKVKKVPKKIVTHRRKNKGSSGKPMAINHKTYEKKEEKAISEEPIVKQGIESMGCDEDDKTPMPMPGMPPIKPLEEPEEKEPAEHPKMPKKSVRTPKKKSA